MLALDSLCCFMSCILVHVVQKIYTVCNHIFSSPYSLYPLTQHSSRRPETLRCSSGSLKGILLSWNPEPVARHFVSGREKSKEWEAMGLWVCLHLQNARPLFLLTFLPSLPPSPSPSLSLPLPLSPSFPPCLYTPCLTSTIPSFPLYPPLSPSLPPSLLSSVHCSREGPRCGCPTEQESATAMGED